MLANRDLTVAMLHGADRCNGERRAVQARVPNPRGEERGLSASGRAPGHAACSTVEVGNTSCCIMLLGLKSQCYPGDGQHEKAGKDA